jgi:uridine kinase
VLFLLTGSAGSGKSTALRELSARRVNVAVFDFDDLRCLLDCADDVRLARIEQRAASGTWRQHTAEEVAAYLRAAARMREAAAGTYRLDTCGLDPDAVATRLEDWMAHARPGRPRRPAGPCALGGP